MKNRAKSVPALRIHAFILIALACIAFASLCSDDASATVNVDFSKKQGTISNTFYGINTHGVWGNPGSRIDIDSDGAEDTASDYQWHRTQMLNAKVGYIRADMALSDVASGVNTFKHGTSNYGSIDTRRNLVAWAAQNNIKVLFTASYMPLWLSDYGSYCASKRTRCPPKNYTEWGALVVNFLNAVDCDKYAGTCEVEVWNEPDIRNYWLPDISETDPQRAVLYNKLYDATYKAVKARYPFIPVGGPGVSTIEDPGSELVYRSFMSSFAGKADFFSFHEYYFDTWDSGNYDGHLQATVMPQLLADCTNYKFNCNRIVIGEMNIYNSNMQVNSPTQYAMQMGLAYLAMLNTRPQSSLGFFDWSEDSKYGPKHYTDYPRRWAMVSEPKLDNTKYAPYGVLLDFANNHRAGAQVVQSSSTTPGIRAVASTDGTRNTLTLINTNLVPSLTQVSLSSIVSGTLQDLKTKQIFIVTNGVVQIPTLGASEIRHYSLTTTSTPAPQPTPPPQNEFVFSWEAESAQPTAPLSTVSKTGASGGKYLLANSGLEGTGKVTYTVNVPSSDTYMLWGRVLSSTDQDDSFLYAIDGGSQKIWDTKISTAWEWDKVNERGGADPNLLSLSAGTHTITVWNREDGTQIDRFLLTNDQTYSPVGLDGFGSASGKEYTWLEAERPTTLTAPMQSTSAASASGGKYLTSTSGSASGGSASFTVQTAQSTNYAIWGRVLGPTAQSDSFYFQIDGGKLFLWDIAQSSQWEWDELADRGIADPLIVWMNAGTHKITVYGRENGAQLDKLLLTNDLSYQPYSMGSLASN